MTSQFGSERLSLQDYAEAIRHLMVDDNTTTPIGTMAAQKNEMAPQLAYGRHRGPVPATARSAAVLIALYFDSQLGWVVPLTKRPEHLEHHPGQICFPGGQVEKGEAPVAAARREFKEELGVASDQAIVVGELTPTYVYASNNYVRSFVALMPPPAVDWSPDRYEVAEVIEFPLQNLSDPNAKILMTQSISVHSREAGASAKTLNTLQEGFFDQLADDAGSSLNFSTPAFLFQEHKVWGATAMLLHELACRLTPTLLTPPF